MKSFIFSKIDINSKKLSKGHKKLVQYISTNYDKAAFMTASKLGEKVGVSESTVVRFATEMGFKGYPELQKELQQMIKSKLTAVQRMEVSSNLIGEDNAIKKVLNGDIELIRDTLEIVSDAEFKKAVDMINDNKSIEEIVEYLEANVEIAEEIGISQAQVSRLEKTALDHIRRLYK